MNRIQGGKPARLKWDRLLDAVITIIKYKKITIDHSIYLKVFSYVTVSYSTVFTNDVLNTNNNETVFTELRIVLKNILRLMSRKDMSLST